MKQTIVEMFLYISIKMKFQINLLGGIRAINKECANLGNTLFVNL